MFQIYFQTLHIFNHPSTQFHLIIHMQERYTQQIKYINKIFTDFLFGFKK